MIGPGFGAHIADGLIRIGIVIGVVFVLVVAGLGWLGYWLYTHLQWVTP